MRLRMTESDTEIANGMASLLRADGNMTHMTTGDWEGSRSVAGRLC